MKSNVKCRIKDHTQYSTVFTKNCQESLYFHVVTPRKYMFLEFKLTFTRLMLICRTCYTDALKYLASGWLILYNWKAYPNLIVCGQQNRGILGRFEEILRIFSCPKYPDRLWAHPISLKWVINTVSSQAKQSELEANHSRPSST